MYTYIEFKIQSIGERHRPLVASHQGKRKGTEETRKQQLIELTIKPK